MLRFSCISLSVTVSVCLDLRENLRPIQPSQNDDPLGLNGGRLLLFSRSLALTLCSFQVISE